MERRIITIILQGQEEELKFSGNYNRKKDLNVKTLE